MIGYTPAEQAIRAEHGDPPGTGADNPPAWHDQPGTCTQHPCRNGDHYGQCADVTVQPETKAAA